MASADVNLADKFFSKNQRPADVAELSDKMRKFVIKHCTSGGDQRRKIALVTVTFDCRDVGLICNVLMCLA